MSFHTRLTEIQEQIAAAATQAGRSPDAVLLIGVSKTHPASMIEAALAAGVADFGENRVQEAEEKIAALAAERERVRWHLIGHLQRNKARKAAALFDLIHSVDSLALAETLSRVRGELEMPPLPVLLQVNVSGEASKEGFALVGWETQPAVFEQFAEMVAQILALPHLDVRGLMTIAPWSDNPETARPVFRSARLLRDALAGRFPAASWRELSMGMTDDVAVAIAEGATMVRIGRALFGERTP